MNVYQAKAKQYPEAELLLFKNYLVSSSCYHPKIIGDLLKKMYRNQIGLFKWGYMVNYNENETENEK